MNIEEIFMSNISDEINHQILMNLFKEAGVDEESVKKASDQFWERSETKLNRQLGVIKNEDVHKIIENGNK